MEPKPRLVLPQVARVMRGKERTYLVNYNLDFLSKYEIV